MTQKNNEVAVNYITATDAEVVPLKSLRRFPGNARKGNLEMLRQSLISHGQYRPLVVNVKKEGKFGYVYDTDQNTIVAGNNLHEAMESLGWDECAITKIDVDDDQATKINLIDNRSNDGAGYDDAALLALMEQVSNLEGTGWNQDEFDDLIAKMGKIAETEKEDFKGGHAETKEEEEARKQRKEGGDEKTHEARGLKEVVLLFSHPHYDEFLKLIREIRSRHETDSTSATVMFALRRVVEHGPLTDGAE